MKKVLLACDGKNFPAGSFSFLRWMSSKEPIFVKGLIYTPVNKSLLVPVAFAASPEALLEMKEEQEEMLNQAVHQFKDACSRLQLVSSVSTTGEFWTPEDIVTESRFADLLILSEELFCRYQEEEQPNTYMQQVLQHAEAPVLLIPEDFQKIAKIIFAYDGKRDSVFAIKEFVHLFPYFSDLPVEIVFLREELSDEIPDERLLKEYTGSHFRQTDFEKLHFSGRKYFATWAAGLQDSIIVSGSYGRSGLSTAMRESFAERLIADHTQPLFIAHYS